MSSRLSWKDLRQRGVLNLKGPFLTPLVLALLCLPNQTLGANAGPALSFDAYSRQLSSGSDSIIFAASCEMANGHVGVMTFAQHDGGGWYFELNGNKTIRSERIIAPGGGFIIKTNHGTRYLGKRDEAIRTLIMLPYHLIPFNDLGVILRVPPAYKCFESQ